MRSHCPVFSKSSRASHWCQQKREILVRVCFCLLSRCCSGRQEALLSFCILAVPCSFPPQRIYYTAALPAWPDPLSPLHLGLIYTSPWSQFENHSSGELSLTSLQFDMFLWLINVCLSYRLHSMRITKNVFLFTSLSSAPGTVLIKWVCSFNLQQSAHRSNLLILVPEQLLCASTYPSLINRGDYDLNIQLDLR